MSAFESALLYSYSVSEQNSKNSLPRRQAGWKFLIVLAVVCGGFLLSPAESSSEGSLSSSSLIALVNEDRLRDGLNPLQENALLKQAAQAKAEHILENSYFAHTSPAGVEPWDFIKDTGLKYAFAGENLAINYTNSFELHHDFLASPTHRANLLSPWFSEIGIAVIEGQYQGRRAVVTVEMFASP